MAEHLIRDEINWHEKINRNTDDFTARVDNMANEKSFRKRLDYDGSVNQNFVILLHQIGTSSVAYSAPHCWCNGTFSIIRSDGNALTFEAQVFTRAGHNSAWNTACLMEKRNDFSVTLVTCDYGGKTYVALKAVIASNPHYIWFNGETNTLAGINSDSNSLRVIKYWDSATSTVLNTEIYNSLKTITESGYFSGHPIYGVGSTVTPTEPNKFSLGSATLPWKDIYANNLNIANFPIESGNWTPVLYGTTVEGSPTYNIRGGHYMRHGKFVYITGYLSLVGKGGLGGDVRIRGLPFQPSAGSTGNASNISGMSLSTGHVAAPFEVRTTDNCLVLKKQNATASFNVSATDITDSFAISVFSATYLIA